ncbi:hypothetical protein Acr_00g0017960 [Actinidia rufa]|uniref:Uncharacterized protein n=1 Tax=Actinidia rufa TaxID=165716 RepID=A0A7J0DBB9_9ERIC|nr:hypothetical protein Acr_00g0017960 [Actinidia rufa]
MIAEETLKNLSFAVGKVLISTTVMDSINKTVELDNNGSLTQIRVMEEQLMMNTVLRTDCACPCCLMEPPSLNQTLDETSTQPPVRTTMALVPFTRSSGCEHTTRGSRPRDYSSEKGRKASNSYLEALMSNLGLPKLSNDPTKDKPKRKQRSIKDILGLPKHLKAKKSGRRGKQKCVVFRSVMAAAAFSISIEGITNRNRILIGEAKAAWSVTRILGTDYMGNDEDVISRIMVTDEEAELGDVLGISEVDSVHIDADGSAVGLITLWSPDFFRYAAILRWCGVSWVAPASLIRLFHWWRHWSWQPRVKVIWAPIPLAVLWSIWNAKNKKIFDNKPVNWVETTDLIMARIAFWVSSSKDGRDLSMDDIIFKMNAVITTD